MSQPPVVVGLVLLAALLHAIWNALVKSSGDAWLTSLLVFASGSLVCSLALPFVEPPARESWPFLAAGVAIHNVYLACLLLAYRLGDLSHVYPLARGSAPLLVALASGRVVDEALSATELAGTALVCGGVLSLALDRGLARGAERRAALAALATGVLIASYTIVDGMGVRRAAMPLGYIVWLQSLEAVPFVVATAALRGPRVCLAFACSAAGLRGAGGGLLATAGYSLVLWAYSLGALAPVAALRETSTILAALLGTLLLGEPFGRRRVVAAALVAAGAVALNL